MIIDGKRIIIDGYSLENWGHFNWMFKMIEQNGKMLWGERNQPKLGEPKPSATILKLVKDD